MAAYVDYLNGLCPGCGQPLSETLRDERKPDGRHWEVNYLWCRSCQALERAQWEAEQKDQRARRAAGRDTFVPSRHRRWKVDLIAPHTDEPAN